jgi:8-oxo-dGTP pyrophosphatase MutT (NUDIX family)
LVHSVAMSASIRNARASRVTTLLSADRTRQPRAKSVRLSQISRMRECEQVAAVCYRIRRGAIEFLLVQTRGSARWIFPKGSAEPGLTHAQAAAIEAFEEAGVHGRIEEAAFVRYVSRRQRNRGNARRSVAKTIAVSAHLCEVRRLSNPKEPNRNRTWFSVEETKQRLREDRNDDEGAEFTRVVQRAVARINRLCSGMEASIDQPGRQLYQNDELHRVQFEASTETLSRLNQARQISLSSRRLDNRKILSCEVLPFAAQRYSNRVPHLLPSGLKVKALGAGSKNS